MVAAAVACSQLGIPFDEVLHRFTSGGADDFRGISPSGKVPWLVDDGTVVWDSLAIAEYLAERHPGVWPAAAPVRAWARCAAAEMHSGFSTLRSLHGMNLGVRVAVAQRPPALLADIARIESLWNEGLARFGGPFLAGRDFTAVDAFFAPVAYRFRSYGIAPQGAAGAYLASMLALPAMREWEAAALADEFRIPQYEAELAQIGRVTADLRRPAR